MYTISVWEQRKERETQRVCVPAVEQTLSSVDISDIPECNPHSLVGCEFYCCRNTRDGKW